MRTKTCHGKSRWSLYCPIVELYDMTDEHENFVHAEDAQVLEGGGETMISTLVLPHPDPSLAKKVHPSEFQ